MKVTTTSVTQTANEILGTRAKILYYLILGEGEKKYVINVGEKTFNAVKELLEEEEQEPQEKEQLNPMSDEALKNMTTEQQNEKEVKKPKRNG